MPLLHFSFRFLWYQATVDVDVLLPFAFQCFKSQAIPPLSDVLLHSKSCSRQLWGGRKSNSGAASPAAPSRAPAPPQGAAPALGSPLCMRRARRLLPHRRAAGRAKLSEFRHYDELMTVHVKTCICNWHLQASEQRKKMIISNWKVPMVVNTCPAMLCVNFQSLDAMMTVHVE